MLKFDKYKHELKVGMKVKDPAYKDRYIEMLSETSDGFIYKFNDIKHSNNASCSDLKIFCHGKEILNNKWDKRVERIKLYQEAT